MIKAVIFDWGGVLIDNPSAELIQYCSQALKIDTQTFQSVFPKYVQKFQKGQIPEMALWKDFCTSIQIDPPLQSIWKPAAEKIFKDKPEIFDLIKSLKSRGYKIGFLSNTEAPAMEYFFENGYQKYFDMTVFSCAENMEKPDAEIYQLALSRLGVTPEEAIFIDDKEVNIEGAKKVGLHGIVFQSVEQVLNELSYLLEADVSSKSTL